MFPYIYIIIPSYGLMAFLGFCSVSLFLYFQLESIQMPFTQFIKIMLYIVAGIFLGSKFLFAITRIGQVHLSGIADIVMLFISSGYVYYGGLFGAIAGIALYCGKNRTLRKSLFSIFTPTFPLFHFFGRIGCFLAGCCYGRPLNPAIRVISNVAVDRYPVQIIEAIFELLLFCILLRKSRVTNRDINLWDYLLPYSIFRFLIEYFRGDTIRGIFILFSTSQWISLFIIIFYVVFEKLGISIFRKRKEGIEV